MSKLVNFVAEITLRHRLAIRIATTWALFMLLSWIKSQVVFKVGIICRDVIWKETCFFLRDLFAVLPTCPCVFNSTLGYPGERWRSQWSRRQKRRRNRKRIWSEQFVNLALPTWNTRSMTKERFECCKGLGYDVLVVTELW